MQQKNNNAEQPTKTIEATVQAIADAAGRLQEFRPIAAYVAEGPELRELDEIDQDNVITAIEALRERADISDFIEFLLDQHTERINEQKLALEKDIEYLDHHFRATSAICIFLSRMSGIPT